MAPAVVTTRAGARVSMVHWIIWVAIERLITMNVLGFGPAFIDAVAAGAVKHLPWQLLLRVARKWGRYGEVSSFGSLSESESEKFLGEVIG